MYNLAMLSARTRVVLVFFLVLLMAERGNAQGPPKVTMLIAYTKPACQEVGTKTLHEMVHEAVNATNQAFVNSNIGCQIEVLPQFVEVDYMQEHTNDTMGLLLDEFQKPGGQFNDVHQERLKQKADLMCLIFSGVAGGVAELNGSIMVNSLRGLEVRGGGGAFPHEVGHLFGATHEGGMRVPASHLGPYFADHRTILGPGGGAIPYYSENRTVTTLVQSSMIGEEPKILTTRIGDATHDNASTMRKNAPLKPKIGENLSAVSHSPAALKSRLVNPLTDPGCPNAKKPFELKDFSVTRSGKNVNVNFAYEATDRFTDDAVYSGSRWRIAPFTKDGKPDPYNGNVTGMYNAGAQNKKQVFKGHPTIPGKQMENGSYIELQYVTKNKDGTCTVNQVAKRIYITDTGIRVDNLPDGNDPPPIVTAPTPDPKVTGTKDSTNPVPQTNQTASSGAGVEPFEVFVRMRNYAKESYEVKLERNGTTIGEYFLAGSDDMWDGKRTNIKSEPAFEYPGWWWRTNPFPITLRKNGKTRQGTLVRIQTGARFLDVLSCQRVGSSEPPKRWVIKQFKASSNGSYTLKDGTTVRLYQLDFEASTDLR